MPGERERKRECTRAERNSGEKREGEERKERRYTGQVVIDA